MSTEAVTEGTPRDEKFLNGLSVVLCLVVAFLILGPRPEWAVGQVDVSALPTVNATLNSITALLLVAGFTAIKQGRRELHKRLMMTAFCSSSLFLLVYVIYHWFSAGPTPYEGDFRAVYLFILFSHIVLAAVILPFALNTLWRGWTGRLVAHRRIAPGTFWTWLYVSVTGVAIYAMLYL